MPSSDAPACEVISSITKPHFLQYTSSPSSNTSPPHSGHFFGVITSFLVVLFLRITDGFLKGKKYYSQHSF